MDNQSGGVMYPPGTCVLTGCWLYREECDSSTRRTTFQSWDAVWAALPAQPGETVLPNWASAPHACVVADSVRVRGIELRRIYSPPGTVQRFSLSSVAMERIEAALEG